MKTIYLLGDVGYEITAKSLQKELPKESKEKVRIIIDSPGGSAAEGIRIHNLIKSYKGDVEIIMGAMAASSASYIAMAVPKEKRKAFKNSSMMIHEASAALQGRARDFKIKYDRLTGINNIIADSYSENMGIPKDKILEMMSEDYYITGWEQLLEHNLITDIVDPKDIDFPEPTQGNSFFDFFFAQLDKEQDENSVKEKMYQSEERSMEDWKQNHMEFEQAVALLTIDHKPEEIQVEDNIITEEKMNLQEFLKANPEAEAEYNANLLSAEEKGKAENVEKERARIVNILKHAGAKVAENVIEALDGGMDDNQFAVEELNRQKENKSVGNKQVFASLESVPQTPAEQDPQTVTEVKPEEIRAKVKNVLDSIGGI